MIDEPKNGIAHNVENFTDAEYDKLADFISFDDLALDRLLRIYIINRDENFDNAEAIVLFKDEVLIRVKGKGSEKVWDEKLGIKREQELDADYEISIPRKSLLSIGVFKDNCDCEDCQLKKENNHPIGYHLSFVTAGSSLPFAIKDKDEAFEMKSIITFWMSDKAVWKEKKKKRKKK